MKAAISLCLFSLAGAAVSPIHAQQAPGRSPSLTKNMQGDLSGRTITFHNPYTSANVTADFLMPRRVRPLAAVVLVTGASRREQTATASLARFLAERGYAVMSMAPIAVSGATEEDSLNTVAALHYLETKPELQGAKAGLAGYGEGVRLAATAASQGNPAAFLMLLGGAVVPDRLNALPDKLTLGTLPKADAVRSLEHVNCPILILIGEYDRQGTHRNAAANAEALRGALNAGKHQNYTIKVMTDSDDLLEETRGGQPQAAPSPAVWKTAVDWTNKQVRALDPASGTDEAEAAPGKPIRIYPKSVYGPFNFRPDMVWAPEIGGQQRPFGYWYW